MLRVSEGRPSGSRGRKPGIVLLVNYNLCKAEISRRLAGHLPKVRIWLPLQNPPTSDHLRL